MGGGDMYLISSKHLSTPECPKVKWTDLKILYKLGNTEFYRSSVFSLTQHVALQQKLGLVSRLAFCASVLL
jgi:hypothetical protein